MSPTLRDHCKKPNSSEVRLLRGRMSYAPLRPHHGRQKNNTCNPTKPSRAAVEAFCRWYGREDG
eukprot:4957722-Amphidinium_carterae.1